MNLIDFKRVISSRLSIWAVWNILMGLILAWIKDPFWRGFGVQAVGWGVVNSVIAFFSARSTPEQSGSLENEGTLPHLEAERRKLSNLLWINAGLDVLYVLGGMWIIRRKGKQDRFWKGQGWGVIFQGGFLFFFDILHALAWLPPRK